ncbi:crotonase/enoyl-CoA hydratase family protein [Congregibacter brevis]|uniref:Crotonase/enoyl-CoA hydratase family protein n=1 Tax=Congregibacter brevis TaxID=3081201 RepID=A0ABZ0I9F9_9GAMM|nr:crotonase/enoyl-CoA hydratase family protein [Congregibacter sp. IMCC45268]
MRAKEFDCLNYEVDSGVATITLNRPDKLNAMTPLMFREFVEALDLVDTDDDVRAVIVTGAGKGFCAGADLTPTGDSSPFAADEIPKREDGTTDYSHESVRDGGGFITLRLYQCKKPVIAAINGACVGAGASMIVAMDIRLASEKAKFGYVFARRGIVPESASAWFLPQIVGRAQALEWCMTGRVFTAGEALAGGLVRSIHPADELLQAARELAMEIIENTAPVSVALTRHMLWRLPSADHPMAAHQIDSRGVFSRSKSTDAAEGVSSFLEKRAPQYPNAVSTDMPDFFPWWEEPDYQ